jgi:hypothetical protein
MNKMVYIYTLSEDGSDEIRYVGQTVNPGVRLMAHIGYDTTGEANPSVSGLKV